MCFFSVCSTLNIHKQPRPPHPEVRFSSTGIPHSFLWANYVASFLFGEFFSPSVWWFNFLNSCSRASVSTNVPHALGGYVERVHTLAWKMVSSWVVQRTAKVKFAFHHFSQTFSSPLLFWQKPGLIYHAMFYKCRFFVDVLRLIETHSSSKWRNQPLTTVFRFLPVCLYINPVQIMMVDGLIWSTIWLFSPAAICSLN